ncbi:hypothetical protein BN7_70 [Wickerhamomyces ciferrii]|uniref:Glutamate--tRNA ligase, mitochondrial n=1 Tax=Wickerhamomyces ciferrii (strain ATCC 14091 / BCRC 22168 / CBS 111 / JCM 3599 / NBRC 0793 / NRRL Y-1031 F-60-10) TaxID=1206466 RepID=K0KE67_WICCF|nr:uncharacterized protein BN7_70 [Wickerhamomyces ciferrii]CCH40537.1 hypothetical protein BN7_70 [Wickerhamomyces ciferrii]
MLRFIRSASTLTLKPKKKLNILKKKNVNPTTPARTRFAPSPTGFLHLGSLRTALYNYLLAKRTGGQFLLRLEDTDQKRLVQGAEQNIYDSLKWCGLHWDEGPIIGGKYGPYRQSDRSHIYKQYADKLLASGDAYRCFCSKERLDGLRESAMKLQPPTTVTYDRSCAHIHPEESNTKAANNETFTVRFKSPSVYPKVEDLLHGTLDLQPQVNSEDVRYDDPILVKSDGLPTYHFANVVDDHLMNITHVIRGEEWLPSTPKHIALYHAFGWDAPSFIHIPLLTSTKDKKLSKRTGDIDVMNFKQKGYLPEALINFVALFGWSPLRDANKSLSEILSLKDLENQFTVSELTKGNAKVDDKKLIYFNKHYLLEKIESDFDSVVEDGQLLLSEKYPNIDKVTVSKLINEVKHNFTFLSDIQDYDYLLSNATYDNEYALTFLEAANKDSSKIILENFISLESPEEIDRRVNKLLEQDFKKKDIFQALRFALSGGIPGLKIPLLINFLGLERSNERILHAIKLLQ